LLSFSVTFADVTVYGMIDQAYLKSKKTSDTTNQSTKTTNSITGVQNGGSDIGFKGSEDLGSNTKAEFVYELGISAEKDPTPTNRQAFVSISGDGGSLKVGKQYSQAFLNSVHVDPLGATGVAGAVYANILLTGNGGDADGPLRQANGLQYTLPSFAQGLGATLTHTVGTEQDSKAGDGNGIALNYANGGLYAGLTYDITKKVGIIDPTDPLKMIAAASSNDSNKLTTISGGYDMGVANLTINYASVAVGQNNIKNTAVGVKVPFGNISFGASISSGTLNVYSNALNKLFSPKINGYQLGLDYALSKRTVAYIHMGQVEVAAITNGQAVLVGRAKQNDTAFGLRHSF